MQNPPLAQPTPQTCRNCGAGLDASLQLCPNCGEPLQKPSARAPLGAISAVPTVLGLLFFGAIGACGVLLFGLTAFSLASGTADADGLSGAFLLIGLPALLVGLVGLMWFIWFLKALISKDNE